MLHPYYPLIPRFLFAETDICKTCKYLRVNFYIDILSPFHNLYKYCRKDKVTTKFHFNKTCTRVLIVVYTCMYGLVRWNVTNHSGRRLWLFGAIYLVLLCIPKSPKAVCAHFIKQLMDFYLYHGIIYTRPFLCVLELISSYSRSTAYRGCGAI